MTYLRPQRVREASVGRALLLGVTLLGVSASSVWARSVRHTPLVYAVVVGHNGGWGVLPQLHYADDDALRFYRLVTRLTPAKNVALLTELDVETWRRLQLANTPPPPYLAPTKRRLQQVLALFKRQVAIARHHDPRRPVHLYFFFSGHGEKGYFLLKKLGDKTLDGAFTARDLRGAFADSEATLNGLFIDACKSKSLFTAKGKPAGDDELGPDFSHLIKKVEAKIRRLPIGVLTSTMSDRPAGEARSIGGGFFSHVLISGLAGAADANSDGVVRYGELAAFVSFHTRRVSGQRPWFRPPRGKMSAPLVWLTGRKDLLVLPPGFSGHFAIFDARSGVLAMEVHKTAAQWTRLILSPGDYKVVWVRSRRFGLLARVHLTGKRSVRLMRRGFVSEVSLSRLGLAKGRVTRQASSLPTGDPLPGEDRVDVDRTIAAFDPTTTGFSEAFSPRVVEMLETAYASGLGAAEEMVFSRGGGRATSRPSRWNHLAVSYGYAGAPAEPYVSSQGVAVRYAREVPWGPGALLVGARLAYMTSAHPPQKNNDRGFSMHRFAAQAEGSYHLPLVSGLSLGLGIYAGWQLVMLVKPQPLGDQGKWVTTLSGDAASFRGGLMLDVTWRFWGGWSLLLSGGYGFDYLHQGSRSAFFARPQVLTGVGYAF